MPLREPRMEDDRQVINSLLGWSGSSIPSICKFIQTITIASCVGINGVFVYNRGKVKLEDTERRLRECWMISIWSSKIDDPDADCLFQQPVPIYFRFDD